VVFIDVPLYRIVIFRLCISRPPVRDFLVLYIVAFLIVIVIVITIIMIITIVGVIIILGNTA
jgi:hypothetical protein